MADRGKGVGGGRLQGLFSGGTFRLPGSPGGLNSGMQVGSLMIGGTPKLHFGDYTGRQDPVHSPGGFTFSSGGPLSVKRIGGF